MNKTLFIATAVIALALGTSAASAQTTFSFYRLPSRTLSFPTQTVTSSPTPAPRPGTLTCSADENGAYARATFVAMRSGQRVASGECGAPVSVPAGTYDVTITLETALDRPQRTVRTTVTEGGAVQASARFATAILEVRFTSSGAPAAGMAIIRRDGREIGTLGSGIPARLSAGRYEIVARYRTTERVYVVDLAPEQRRAVYARF